MEYLDKNVFVRFIIPSKEVVDGIMTLRYGNEWAAQNFAGKYPMKYPAILILDTQSHNFDYFYEGMFYEIGRNGMNNLYHLLQSKKREIEKDMELADKRGALILNERIKEIDYTLTIMESFMELRSDPFMRRMKNPKLFY